ncbi:MAG: ATP-binding protein, partial [Planctomycetota bacterium]
MGDPQAQPEISLEMYSRPKLLAAARAMVGNVAQRLGFNDVECGQISLAVDEALCNIINHGYERSPDGRIWIRIWSEDSGDPLLKIVVEDRARQVDPESIQPRSLDDIRPGGLGVFIIREVMDEVHYEQRDNGGMRLTMIKRLPEPDDESAA